MSSFFTGLVDVTKNEYAASAFDGIQAGDVQNFIDTGSYIFNALVSGSIYGGVPSNKITAIAGEEATGKTFFTLGVVKQFLDDHPEAACMYFETESAITKNMIESRGIDSKRVFIVPVTTVQEFTTQAVKVLDKYSETKEKERPPMMFVLDSLGMLSTSKEVGDIAEGKETKDMTRAQLVKATFRVLTLKLGRLNVPMIVTNHTYESMGLFSSKKMSGGTGLKYAASSIIFLSKKKDKDGNDVIGNIIHCLNKKSRLTKENKKVDVRLTYAHGLERYYGLVDLAVECGAFKKVSTRIELPDGTKAFAKSILKDPEKHFTKEVLDQIDAWCKKEFMYGSDIVEDDIEEEDGTEL